MLAVATSGGRTLGSETPDTPATPGFVAGPAKTDVRGAVAVPGGWMVPYDETIAGTDVTFDKGEDPDLPAVTMTQFAARQYTKWISGLSGRFYRLPAESEWEYACRTGSTTPWNSGADAAGLDAVAWFAENSDDTPHKVGLKKANAWGLHDMHGNVVEWVIDELGAGGYARQAALPLPVAAAEDLRSARKGRR